MQRATHGTTSACRASRARVRAPPPVVRRNDATSSGSSRSIASPALTTSRSDTPRCAAAFRCAVALALPVDVDRIVRCAQQRRGTAIAWPPARRRARRRFERVEQCVDVLRRHACDVAEHHQHGLRAVSSQRRAGRPKRRVEPVVHLHDRACALAARRSRDFFVFRHDGHRADPPRGEQRLEYVAQHRQRETARERAVAERRESRFREIESLHRHQRCDHAIAPTRSSAALASAAAASMSCMIVSTTRVRRPSARTSFSCAASRSSITKP